MEPDDEFEDFLSKYNYCHPDIFPLFANYQLGTPHILYSHFSDPPLMPITEDMFDDLIILYDE